MELMDTSLDKFYKQVIEKGLTIPEDILGKIAISVGSHALASDAVSRQRRLFSTAFLFTCAQIVKALEHLHSSLQVIHRGDEGALQRRPPPAPWSAPCYRPLTNFSGFSRHRRETIQRADQHSGPGEDVRLRHQRLPRGLGG